MTSGRSNIYSKKDKIPGTTPAESQVYLHLVFYKPVNPPGL